MQHSTSRRHRFFLKWSVLLGLFVVASTGYMWYVHPKSTAVLKLIRQRQTDPTEPGVGRPVVQVFTFEPRRKGDGILLMRYVRSWEKPVLGEEQFSVNVEIE